MNEKLPLRTENFPAWYQSVVKHAQLAEQSDTHGAMVMLPYGFALWDNIKSALDQQIKATGHQNVYFPLLIPVHYFAKEADHIAGFAKECAVVTHYRLTSNPTTQKLTVDPKAKLENPLVVRPTSETIIWHHFRKWIQSYRDLPLLINQWANVVRWEMRTRPFLRTSEFLWQEGHTAHATPTAAQQEALKMLHLYNAFIKDYLAIPVILGEKTSNEQFAGAQTTYTLEALMQDGKALQIGTSHFLGQNFAKAFDVKFTDQKGHLTHVWGSSWGLTTRLLGALIMVHGDDHGLVLPPKIAPIQVVIIPIYKKGTPPETLQQPAQQLASQLKQAGIKVHLDLRDHHQPGWKFNEYEKKGVPLRIAIGPRDLANNTVELTRRDTMTKTTLPINTHMATTLQKTLDTIQTTLYEKALAFQDTNTTPVDDMATFQKVLTEKGGFISAHWDGTTATELAIKAATQATIRCIPFTPSAIAGKCLYSGKSSAKPVLFARAY